MRVLERRARLESTRCFVKAAFSQGLTAKLPQRMEKRPHETKKLYTQHCYQTSWCRSNNVLVFARHRLFRHVIHWLIFFSALWSFGIRRPLNVLCISLCMHLCTSRRESFPLAAVFVFFCSCLYSNQLGGARHGFHGACSFRTQAQGLLESSKRGGIPFPKVP